MREWEDLGDWLGLRKIGEDGKDLGEINLCSTDGSEKWFMMS